MESEGSKNLLAKNFLIIVFKVATMSSVYNVVDIIL